ncbi:hypothetical protein [Nitrosomonas ureae]|uniref:STAS domain-containing protein n=1 Tax=Nitrosomonas ureae TaxID=44577 RepID=A0A1H9H2Y7_9PROT|nr:hypothetical protein [Nitrosomonas ureae]SEQ56724.1 hypothetical protein SAMN05421510_10866 [Nitrosomonas ureae]
MKKLFIKTKFIRFNEKRSEDRQIRRNSHAKWKIRKHQLEFGIPKKEIKRNNKFKQEFPNYEIVIAPLVFSFIKNTNDVIKFIARLKNLYDLNKKVYISLENIKVADYSAVVVLLSIMVKFRSKNIAFYGDMPLEKAPKDVIVGSGFFKNLYKTFDENDSYDISTINQNGIHTHAAKNVDAALSAKIIDTSANYIWGESRRCPGVQRVLIELMQNTNNHAEIGKSGEKHWWLSVNQNNHTKKVSFAFVDFGVGIFTNLENKPLDNKFYGWAKKMMKKFNYGNNAKLFELILNGQLHQTVTEQHYRGKGLPGIAEVFKRNQISNLHIITNDVFCNLSNQKFEILDNTFSGTFLYWELGENNGSIK